MSGWAYLAFVLLGTSYAAYRDLKTSEVSDAVSLVIGGGGILYFLTQSITLPVTEMDIVLIVACFTLAASVVSFLRLGVDGARSVFSGSVIEYAIDRYDARVGPLRVTDLFGTVFMAVTIVLFALSAISVGVTPVTASFFSGIFLFTVGWSMYLLGMWGGADAFVLGAVGFALPQLPGNITPVVAFNWPFPLTLLMTVFLVGSVYSLLYTFALTMQDHEAIASCITHLRSRQAEFATVAAAYILGAGVLGVLLQRSYRFELLQYGLNATLFFVFVMAVLVLHTVLKSIERTVMTKTVPASEIEAGAVLAEDVVLPEKVLSGKYIDGVSADDAALIRDHCDEVTVKSGVRFIAAFPLAILVLVTIGDVMSLIVMMLSGG